MKRIAVIGAGGFAREVAWLIRDINEVTPSYEFIGYLVSDLTKVGPHDSANELLGDFSWLSGNRGGVDCLAMGIGNPAVKVRIGEELKAAFPNVEWPALIHPSARFDRPSATIAPGVVMCAGVIGTVNLRIDEFAMINLSCTIGHEAVIGIGAVLNPTVNVSGGAHIGNRVLIGTGAQLLQYVVIGDDAVVGAGAVVNKEVPPGDVVAGVPAKSIKK